MLEKCMLFKNNKINNWKTKMIYIIIQFNPKIKKPIYFHSTKLIFGKNTYINTYNVYNKYIKFI